MAAELLNTTQCLKTYMLKNNIVLFIIKNKVLKLLNLFFMVDTKLSNNVSSLFLSDKRYSTTRNAPYIIKTIVCLNDPFSVLAYICLH